MNDPEEAGKYLVENQQVVQGQVIGDYATVHIHHASPQSAPPTPPSASPVPIWNVPFARNPFFTGREALLERLHTQLHATQTVALGQPQAISGLGGIGKTQLAIEYAYRYRQEYQAVLWARAETTEALNASCSELAALLGLPEKEVQEQEVVVQAVKQWLRRTTGWLLILDNVEDLNQVQAFVPTEVPGHLVLTTRTHITGKVAKRLEVDTLEADVGALLTPPTMLQTLGIVF